MKNDNKKMNIKKIGTFLKSISGADYIYLEHTVNIRSHIEKLIKRHKLKKQDICSFLNIKTDKYIDFIKGNYNYTLEDISKLNDYYIKLESKKLKRNVQFKE